MYIISNWIKLWLCEGENILIIIAEYHIITGSRTIAPWSIAPNPPIFFISFLFLILIFFLFENIFCLNEK